MKTVLELEDLANKAVKAALNQQWDTALTLNQEILDETPDSVEAANRLARAYQELGQRNEATAAYQRVLELDPFNAIAQKNIDKLKSGTGTNSQRKVSSELFLEEPGKTRSVVIVSPNTKTLSQYSSGEELTLEEKDGSLTITSPKGEMLGFLTDDLSAHLLKLMRFGNEYSVHLMNTSSEPTVFLREIKQGSSASKYVSFGRSSGGAGGSSLSTPRSLRSATATEADGLPDEDIDDNWDADDSDLHDDSDDDISVSLEGMQDEEERAYNSKDNDY